MQVNRRQLDQAREAGIINESQVDALWQFLQTQTQGQSSFQLAHTLYYLGGLLAIGAMSLFMTLGWERFGGAGLLLIALLYALGGLWLTQVFRRRNLPVPAGVTATFVVVLTPLAVYGLQQMLGFWPEGAVYRQYHQLVDWRWLFMELATLMVAAILLWHYRLAFLVMPLAVTLWYLSMDLAPMLFGEELTFALRRWVSLWFGLLMLLLAVMVDLRNRSQQDFAGWLYLFGVVAFWGGLTLMNTDSELGRFLYCCINLLLILVGVLLRRRVFVVFGGMGVAMYLGRLAWQVFADSLLFPFVLTAIGLAVIGLGILWQKHEASITAAMRSRLPAAMQPWLQRLRH
ncbi:DUF2157 domain-containing protein [Marinospirillum alkaliphilum]|uniref:DUF2157 domain-containing protein n=1 Tax=Marinospirillum alkaliphilum DSM 21637 TaxID=1122209 RepID=A0A1K1WZ24_9GAMM|nr:DUF2157 domain-containing protein [Marinospirillum alkaliphilum]SFX42689.1 hypothetical protein SAMN02745752_01617 [Marinospirillum alkaliphilum DSM 21637]